MRPFDYPLAIAHAAELASTHEYFVTGGPRLAMAARNLALRLDAQSHVLDVGGFAQARDAVLAGFAGAPPRWEIINGETALAEPAAASPRYFDARSDRLPFPDHSFDAVVCWETLE
ncbi:MAG: hypothetical protein EON92_11505, partial [Burkholderiales bacterium]